jgi:hypothetical protein
VAGPPARGQQRLQRLAEHLPAGAPEHALRRRVEDDDALVRIDGDDAVHRQIDDALATQALHSSARSACLRAVMSRPIPR